MAAAGLGLALAASLLLVLRPPPAAERSKGGGIGLTMFVQHGNEVRRAAPGEIVSPGDAVRFAEVTAEEAEAIGREYDRSLREWLTRARVTR